MADDLLTSTLLTARCPVVLAPAMHTEMWEHAATRENVALLKQRGVHVVEPATGRLAGGDEGAGRLAEPADIVVAVERVLTPRDLDGLGVLVTAGGTREPIDPVRCLSNRSSGKQGHALADEAAARGADVTLVTTVDRPTTSGVDVVRVDTAAEMEDAVLSRSDAADVILMAAAVADFRPKATADEKLKKADGLPEILLEPTNDILAELGKRRRPGQTIVGFAAETERLREHAADKLARKGIDLIVANDVSAPDAGFAHDTNRAVILDAEGRSLDVPLSDKRDVARTVLDAVARRRSNAKP
jgi:phosphopantothenoylcysteine decarboxylase/phosphopantothenate--cysteine ligase